MNVKLIRSPKENKKFRVTFPNGKSIDFGAKGYEDYTQHKHLNRRMAYIKRHQKREDWDDIYTAGFWARWLLWEKDNMIDAIVNLKNIFNINLV